MVSFCIFVSLVTSIIISCSVSVDSAYPYDDQSLSNETNKHLGKVCADKDIRTFMRNSAKKAKYNKENLDWSELSQVCNVYESFRQAIIRMKHEMQLFYPKFNTKLEHGNFTLDIENQVLYPESLAVAEQLFAKLEESYDVPVKFRADRKIRTYFYTMYAFLIRCAEYPFSEYLLSYAIIARALRAEILKYHEIADDTEHQQDVKTIFQEFSIFYARIRHGFRCIHHTYGIDILHRIRELKKENATVNFPEVLDSMGILTALNFMKKDFDYFVIMHRMLTPAEPTISVESYYFVNAKNETVEGVLPCMKNEHFQSLSFEPPAPSQINLD